MKAKYIVYPTRDVPFSSIVRFHRVNPSECLNAADKMSMVGMTYENRMALIPLRPATPTSRPVGDVEREHGQARKSCECLTWCSDGRLPLTAHHYNCKRYNLAEESLKMVTSLTKAMELWSAECDGMPKEAFDAYKDALIFTGQFKRYADVVEKEVEG